MTPLETIAANNSSSNLIDSIPEGGRQEGLPETIQQYFECLNGSEFEAASFLFAEEGQLLPPFEEPIIGPEAIAAYLEAEAKGMKLHPRPEFQEWVEEETRQLEVTGKVETAFFKVNVCWLFALNSEAEILRVRVKLLASLKELVNLRKA